MSAQFSKREISAIFRPLIYRETKTPFLAQKTFYQKLRKRKYGIAFIGYTVSYIPLPSISHLRLIFDGDIPDSVVEAFVEKIVVSKDGYDWYLRFDGDPNDPLHLKTEGKRRKNTTIIDPNKQTACEPVRDTDSY